MTFGRGFGLPFGGGALVPLDSPLSNVGDAAPVSFDFTVDPDGPLPGAWSFYVLNDNGGTKSAAAEPGSLTYFRVTGGLGFWKYLRSPSMPGPFDPYLERGLIAAPVGILQGRNARMAVAFVAPPSLLDPSADEFVFEVVLGYRAANVVLDFYGARARATWQAGVWTTPAVLEVVKFTGGFAAVLDTPSMPPTNEATDFWTAYRYGSLEVTFRDNELTTVLNGVITSVVTIPATSGDATPIVMVRVYNRTGAVIAPVPAIAGLELQTLRDIDHLGGIFPNPGDADLEAPIEPVHKLPVQALMDQGYLRRKGARTWEVLQDVDVNVFGSVVGLRTGILVRATEPYTSQEVVSVVFDLANIRGLRERV
jgi:hypothetical protein